MRWERSVSRWVRAVWSVVAAAKPCWLSSSGGQGLFGIGKLGVRFFKLGAHVAEPPRRPSSVGLHLFHLGVEHAAGGARLGEIGAGASSRARI
jgi:hypothetical protein